VVRRDKRADASLGGRRVYVGNLGWGVTWQDLKDFFRPVGDVVRAHVATDAATGRSKGCGIVEFNTPPEAAAAVERMHNARLKASSSSRFILLAT